MPCCNKLWADHKVSQLERIFLTAATVPFNVYAVSDISLASCGCHKSSTVTIASPRFIGDRAFAASTAAHCRSQNRPTSIACMARTNMGDCRQQFPHAAEPEHSGANKQLNCKLQLHSNNNRHNSPWQRRHSWGGRSGATRRTPSAPPPACCPSQCRPSSALSAANSIATTFRLWVLQASEMSRSDGHAQDCQRVRASVAQQSGTVCGCKGVVTHLEEARVNDIGHSCGVVHRRAVKAEHLLHDSSNGLPAGVLSAGHGAVMELRRQSLDAHESAAEKHGVTGPCQGVSCGVVNIPGAPCTWRQRIAAGHE